MQVIFSLPKVKHGKANYNFRKLLYELNKLKLTAKIERSMKMCYVTVNLVYESRNIQNRQSDRESAL